MLVSWRALMKWSSQTSLSQVSTKVISSKDIRKARIINTILTSTIIISKMSLLVVLAVSPVKIVENIQIKAKKKSNNQSLRFLQDETLQESVKK